MTASRFDYLQSVRKWHAAIIALLLLFTSPAALSLPPASRAEHDCATLIAILEAHHPLPVENWPSPVIFFRLLQLVDPRGAYFSRDDVATLMAQHANSFVQSTKENVLQVPKSLFEAAAEKGRERRTILQERFLNPQAFSRKSTPPVRYGWKSSEELDAFWVGHFERLKRSWIAAGASPEEVQFLLRSALDQVGAEKTRALENEKLYFRTLSGAFLSSLDPYSRVERSDPAPHQSGVTGLSVSAFAGELTVVGFSPGSAAEASGALQPRDRIVSVFNPSSGGFEYVSTYSAEEALSLPSATPGPSLKMRVYREQGSKYFEVEIHREPPKPPLPSAKASFADVETEGKSYKLGVIQIECFSEEPESTALRVESQVNFFKKHKVDGIFIDVRNNLGGSLEEVFNVISLFLTKKAMEITVASADPSIGYLANRTTPAWRGPLVVLTDGFSASGAELLAGTVQDFRRGLLLGEPRTYGKGTIQRAFEIGEPGKKTAQANGGPTAYITTGYYFLPSGRSPQKTGIHPDVVFPWPGGQKHLGEAGNLQALPQASRPKHPGFYPRPGFWRAGIELPLQTTLDERLALGEETESSTDPVLEHALVIAAEYVKLLREGKGPIPSDP